MKKKERRINKKIIIIICVFIILMLAALAVVNYIVLPPKPSENAIKYKYHGYNFMHLKSITDDEDSVVFEFSSLNKYFNKYYNQKYYINNQGSKLSINNNRKPFISIKWFEQENPNFYSEYNPDYYIVSTLTSNYLIITNKPQIEDALKSVYRMDYIESVYKSEYRDTEIQLLLSEGYENVTISFDVDYWDNKYGGSELHKKQMYNGKKWNPLVKAKYNYGFTITNKNEQ